MSSSAKFNIEIDQGSDFSMQITIKDSLGVEIDLTGHTFTGQIRKTIADTVVQASFTFNVLDQVANTGKVDITLANAISSAIILPKQNKVTRTAVPMAYDIESEIGGTVTRWLEGTVNISPEVTR